MPRNLEDDRLSLLSVPLECVLYMSLPHSGTEKHLCSPPASGYGWLFDLANVVRRGIRASKRPSTKQPSCSALVSSQTLCIRRRSLSQLVNVKLSLRSREAPLFPLGFEMTLPTLGPTQRSREVPLSPLRALHICSADLSLLQYLHT